MGTYALSSNLILKSKSGKRPPPLRDYVSPVSSFFAFGKLLEASPIVITGFEDIQAFISFYNNSYKFHFEKSRHFQ